MAKTKTLYGYLFCILICSSVAGQSHLTPTLIEGTVTNDTQTRKCVKELYDSQVGVKEEGINSGTAVAMYLQSVGLSEGYPWCAAFLHWCFINNEVKVPKSGWVPSYALKSKRIYERGKFLKRTPQTADVFMIWYRKLNRAGHIGFIDHWGDTYVITVEGNTNPTGSREGDGVYRKRRPIHQIWAVSDFISEPLE